jgi:hypothetical protein
MAEYVIEIPHAPGECPAGLLAAEWTTYSGCRVGTHTTWTIGEFPTPDDAWALVPSPLRDTARVVAVERGGGRSE